jgi:prepilin-type N-terminal cleavage/methylation domain-containing protein/prepilin-type processing-associated H-X9-DG protein
MKRRSRRHPRPAFSLIELIVVIGIITVLIAILLPTLHRARQQALTVKCRANLQQIGQALLIYSQNNHDWIYPPNRGVVDGRPKEEYWPNLVFKPAVWNPPILLCPADNQPALECSYALNNYLKLRQVTYTSKNLGGGKNASNVVVMGETRTEIDGYYLDPGEYESCVEPFRHGRTLKSNYLYLDLHVDNENETRVLNGLEPWDIPPPPAAAN